MIKLNESTILISKVAYLKPGMVITSYLDLEKKYKNLRKIDCLRLLSDFEGAKTTIFRRNRQFITKISNLKAGDTVLKIFDIPKSNFKFTQVDKQLIEYLSENGLSTFGVAASTVKKEKKNGFLEKLKKSEELRKTLAATKTKIYKASNVLFQHDDKLLKLLKKSEESRKNKIEVTKPVPIKWEKPVLTPKDELLNDLTKSENLRQERKSTLEENQFTLTNPLKLQQYYQNIKVSLKDRSNDYLDSMKKSEAFRNIAGKTKKNSERSSLFVKKKSHLQEFLETQKSRTDHFLKNKKTLKTETGQQKSDFLESIKNSEEVRKALKATKSKIYQASDALFQNNSELLKRLKQSEEKRQNIVNITKPTPIKWEKSPVRFKDDILIDLNKSESLRHEREYLLEENKTTILNPPHKLKKNHQSAVENQKDEQTRAYLEGMKKSEELRNMVGGREGRLEQVQENKFQKTHADGYIDHIRAAMVFPGFIEKKKGKPDIPQEIRKSSASQSEGGKPQIDLTRDFLKIMTASKAVLKDANAGEEGRKKKSQSVINNPPSQNIKKSKKAKANDYLDQLRASMVFPGSFENIESTAMRSNRALLDQEAKIPPVDQLTHDIFNMQQSIKARIEDDKQLEAQKISSQKIKDSLSYQKFKDSRVDQADGYLKVMHRSIEAHDDDRRAMKEIEKKPEILSSFQKFKESLADRKDEFLESMNVSIEDRIVEHRIEKDPDNKPKKLKKQAQKIRESRVESANNFIESMRKSIEIRDDAAGTMEEFMDRARRKKPDWQTINYYIDFVVKNSSTTAMSALANIKASDQTYGHCIDVAAIFSSVYLSIKNDLKAPSVFKNKKRVMLAAFLHDFGKSQIPKDIIESTESFARDSQEMQIVRSHPKLGAQLLSDKMNVPSHFINMTLYHHVKNARNHMNSYPEVDDTIDIIYETKLLAIIDVYQALIGKRKYKKPWAPAAAMVFLRNAAGPEFDSKVFNDFRQTIGDYPIGTLVKLNDKSIGFVISVPKLDLSRPDVVLIKDSEGKDLSKHTLINLETERNLRITQDLNTESVLGDAGADMFKQIQVS